MTDAGPIDQDRRRRLLGLKLRALVSEYRGASVDAEPIGFGTGAGLLQDGAAWVIVDGPAGRALGPSLAWAIRQGATSLNVVAETEGGRVARRAAGFDFPISVWFPEERSLLPIVAEAEPEPSDPSAEHLALLALVEKAGAEPHVERGVVTGEVRGLEVCRVVDEPTVGGFAELNDVPPDVVLPLTSGVTLEVGVGATDREAFRIIHGHLPTLDALADVVAAVEAHRRSDAPQHPLNRMAPERYLRWNVMTDPARLDLTDAEAADPPVDRPSMKHPEPCVAVGTDSSGRSVAAVFSSGVDLDLVPFVADVALHRGAEVERLMIVLPERDAVAVTRDLAELLARPVEVVTL
jgi:hypothetical protein